MSRIVIAGSSLDPGLRRVGAALADRGWEVFETDIPGEIDFVLVGERVETTVFDAARHEALVLGRLRRRHPGRTWVAWTAGYSSARAANLLEAGAAEVLNGSMGDAELATRVEAAVTGRRERGDLVVGALRIERVTGEASWDGRDLELTSREREVLDVLAHSAGKTVRREALYRDVWGFAMARGDRTVDVNVKRLRKKLGAAGVPLEIKTRPGVGYRLEIPAALSGGELAVTRL